MIDRIAGALPSNGATPSTTTGASFKRALSASAKTPGKAAALGPGSQVKAAPNAAAPSAGRIVSEVQRAQARLDSLLKLAESGRTFSPAELLAFQTHAYRASQEIDLAGKVVEKGTSAVKQTLQTQL